MGTLKDIGYKVVKNFITIEEANLIKEYCILRHKINFDDIKLNDFQQNKVQEKAFELVFNASCPTAVLLEPEVFAFNAS